MSTLADRDCNPPRKDVPPLAGDALAALAEELGGDWEVVDGHHLRREWSLPDFAAALALVNRIGALAEEVNHHPDLELGWGRVAMELFTHSIDGLSEADFVLAARCERAAR